MDLQVYKDFDDFKKRVILSDPLKTFEDKVRVINWQEQERECKECGESFIAKHPARVFCDNCSEKEDKQNKIEPVIERLKRKEVIKECMDCGNKFVLEAPAMKKCKECSPRGGKVVTES